MAKRQSKTNAAAGKRPNHGADRPLAGLRIIGGDLRGRKLLYSGDLRTRPMKDRLREAIFNLLGPSIRGKHAIDLFAGTGALAFESLSRGAKHATLIEQHRPTANIIRQNAKTLGVEDRVQIVPGNSFIWFRRRPELGQQPWAVFCSPPYAFYVERVQEMLELIAGLIESAPAESVFILESDARFELGRLPEASRWDVRTYPPAVIGIYRKG